MCARISEWDTMDKVDAVGGCGNVQTKVIVQQ